jgi:ADP-heptose:LPS heptosyltransferase
MWPDKGVGPAAGPLVILHPGSGSTRKCWPLPNYVALADKLRATGVDPLFLLGPTEAERLCDDEIAQLRTASPMMTNCSLREVASIIAAGRCFVGNDCGISHLAAALEIPTVAIFGPTDPNTWRPLGEHVTILRAPRPAGWPTVADVARAALGRS